MSRAGEYGTTLEVQALCVALKRRIIVIAETGIRTRFTPPVRRTAAPLVLFHFGNHWDPGHPAPTAARLSGGATNTRRVQRQVPEPAPQPAPTAGRADPADNDVVVVTANTSAPPARRCTRCGEPGHQRPSCTAAVESGPAAGRRCSKCRQHGHNATSHCKECDEVSPSHAGGCSLKPLEYPFRDGPNAVLSEWTGTFTQNRSGCPSSWMDTLYTFFSSILLAVKFVITTERGEREGQLHVHAMV